MHTATVFCQLLSLWLFFPSSHQTLISLNLELPFPAWLAEHRGSGHCIPNSRTLTKFHANFWINVFGKLYVKYFEVSDGSIASSFPIYSQRMKAPRIESSPHDAAANIPITLSAGLTSLFDTITDTCQMGKLHLLSASLERKILSIEWSGPIFST